MYRVKHLFYVFLFILFPTLSSAQFEFPYPYSLAIQAAENNDNTCTFQHAVTAGNYVIVGHSWFSSASSPSVSDTRSTSYTQNVYSASGSGSVGAMIYSGTLGSSGSNTITVTISGETFMQTYCAEFPASFSLTVDGTPTTTNYSGNPATLTGGSVTTTRSGDVLISVAGGFHNASICGPKDSRGAPANLVYKNLGLARNNDGGCWEYQITQAPGSYSNSFTNWNNMDQGLVVTVAYKANAMHISTPLAIPDGALSNTYDYTLGAVGAVSTVTWSGTPPSGLSLNSSTGEITGTPTVSNNYSFSVSASDGTTTDTQTLTMKVATSANLISVVQTKSNTGVQVTPLAFTSNVTSGNLLVAHASDVISGFIGVGPLICSDTVGTIYHRVIMNNMVFDTVEQWFVGIAGGSGANTVTCVGGGGGSDNLLTSIIELQNAQAFGDFSNALWANSASPISSTSLTTPVPNSVVLCGASGRTSATSFTAQAPFTTFGGTLNYLGAYDITTTVTGYSCSYTMTSNTDGNWQILAMALRPSVGTVVPPAARHKGRIL